jgi:hypothetical protein
MLTRVRLLPPLLLAWASLASAQQNSTPPDSTVGQVRAVLRAYYYDLAAQNWDALASYVLSPKLLERRGVPGDSQLVWKDRTRRRLLAHAVAPPNQCPSPASPMVDSAAIRVDGDWAEVSVARCDREIPGVDEFRLLYFEQRWRFIYTDLFVATHGVSRNEDPPRSPSH